MKSWRPHLWSVSRGRRPQANQRGRRATSSPAPTPGSPGVGIAGFVLVIVGLFVPFVRLVGLVLSIVGYRQAKREGLRTGLSLAGVVVGIVAIVTGLIILLVFLGVLGAAAVSTGGDASADAPVVDRSPYLGSWQMRDPASSAGFQYLYLEPFGDDEIQARYEIGDQSPPPPPPPPDDRGYSLCSWP